MPKITSDTSNTNPFSAIPKNWYPARIQSPVAYGKSKSTGNPMLTFGFTVENNSEAPQYNNRQVNFYNVVTGGTDKNGKPMNINRVIEMIVATGVPWDHIGAGCGAVGISRIPLEDREHGMYACPECNGNLSAPGSQISYNSDDFAGKMVKILVDVEKALGSDEDRNSVVRVRSLN
jgi:hypothetical protein